MGAYVIWGLFPAFFGLLDAAGSVEILAHRICWTLVVMGVLLVAAGATSTMRGWPARTWGLVAAASAAITCNWGVYIYAVLSGHVLEAALGYFINPLVSVLLAVLVLRERLRPYQWIALGFGAAAVAVITFDYGRPPYIALVLAFSFGGYGLIKKIVPLDPRASLAGETLVASPFAFGWLVWLMLTGSSTFISEGPGHSALLVTVGVVTAVPLLLFGLAAKWIPLVTIGLLQYLTPILQMLWAVVVLHEDMPASRWIGFALIWAGLMVFTGGDLWRARRAKRLLRR